jgi:signal transduction histidine kinase
MVKAVVYVAAFVALPTLVLVHQHTQLHGFNFLQALLALFCAINVMICWWELGLFFNRKLIKAQYNAFRKRLGKHEVPNPMFMFEEVSVKRAFTLRFWALVWSTYSLMDPRCVPQLPLGHAWVCSDVAWKC